MATVQINGNLKRNERGAIFVYDVDEDGHGVRTYDESLHTAYIMHSSPPPKYLEMNWTIYYENDIGFTSHNANKLRDSLYNAKKNTAKYEYLVSIDGFESYWALKSHREIKRFLHLDKFEMKTLTGMHLTIENRLVVDSKTFNAKEERRFVHY